MSQPVTSAEILPIRRDEATLWRVFVLAFEAYEADPTEINLALKMKAFRAFSVAYCGRAVA